jgi:hypothetical protein
MAANSIVRLSLESAQYEQKLRGAKRQFEDFTNSIGINMKQMTAAGLAFGAAATAINAFTSACSEAISRGIELARQSEGIRRAFDRLNQPNLLQNLREATHNTVSDLELMKNAVKFDNFNLSLEQMGTFLAFAQQQAKDTGQSVEYMVDSIVTGLGRKSLPILDNLGLSAVDIRAKMAEVGDMTTAVAEIIKERMDKAGGYVETAADRAAQANAKLENAMLELGNAMQEVFGYTGWDDMAKGIKTELVGALTFTVETIGRAKDAWNSLMQAMGIQNKPQKKPSTPSGPAPNGTYVEQTDSDGNIQTGHWMNGEIKWESAGVTITGHKRDKTKTTKTPRKTGSKFDASKLAFNPTMDESLKADPDRYFQSVWAMADQSALRSYMGFGKKQYDSGRIVGSSSSESNEEQKQMVNNVGDIANNIGRIFSGLETLGVEIPKELQTLVGGIQVVTGILTAISSIVTIIAAIQGTKAIPIIGWALANGGVIHGANGIVPGRSFSGDNIPAMLNSGETVLTRAQSSNLVSMLNNNGLGNLQLETVVSGEDLKFVLNNTGRRTGTGEIMTSTMRRI